MNRELLIHDQRPRNILIQTDANFAIIQILNIQRLLKRKNKKIELEQIIDEEEIRIDSTTLGNYFINWSIVFIIRHYKSTF
jgi:hypothetical protein